MITFTINIEEARSMAAKALRADERKVSCIGNTLTTRDNQIAQEWTFAANDLACKVFAYEDQPPEVSGVWSR